MSGFTSPTDTPSWPLLDQPDAGNPLAKYTDQLRALSDAHAAGWNLNNPVGTETARAVPSVGAPAPGGFDPLVALTPGGQATTAGDVAGVRSQLQAGSDVALGTVLGMTGDAPGGNALRVYHGSPHAFEPVPDNPLGAFSLDKLGTGEGAQAYGHGVYQAGAEGVARTYRDALSSQATFTHPDVGPMSHSAAVDAAGDMLPDMPQNEHLDPENLQEGARYVSAMLSQGKTPDAVAKLIDFSAERGNMTPEQAEAHHAANDWFRDFDVKPVIPTVGGEPYNPDDVMHKAAFYLDRNGYDEDKALDNLDDELTEVQGKSADFKRSYPSAQAGDNPYDTAASNIMNIKRAIDDNRGNIPQYKAPGHMYESELNVDPEHMLDWDKPLSEQSQHVQDALRSSGIVPDPATPGAAYHFGYTDEEFSALPPYRQRALIAQTPPSAASYAVGDPTGADIHQKLAERLARSPPPEAAGWGSVPGGPVRYDSQVHDPAAAAAKLQAAGIPAIRYQDAMSRVSPSVVDNAKRQLDWAQQMQAKYAGGGDPETLAHWNGQVRQYQAVLDKAANATHNYVVFDPKTINIIRRYGIAGALTGGAAAAAGAGGQQPEQ